MISVRNHRGGIPEAVREHIFEAFFTTKKVGDGALGTEEAAMCGHCKSHLTAGQQACS